MIVVVWVLMLYFPGGRDSGASAMVVDNIASREDCIALGNKMLISTGLAGAHCYQVRKIVPKA
jgi:hypothetical protein